jgi:hypothetical protein
MEEMTFDEQVNSRIEMGKEQIPVSDETLQSSSSRQQL